MCQRTGGLATLSVAFPDTFGGLRKGGLFSWDSKTLRSEDCLQPAYKEFNLKRSLLYKEWLINK